MDFVKRSFLLRVILTKLAIPS